MKTVVAIKMLLLVGGVTGILLSRAMAAAPIDVVQPYARAIPPGQPNSAVFMTLKNTGATTRALVQVTSPASEVAELHVHRHVEGMMQMRQVEKITIPPGGETQLKPGGFHIMLIRVKRDLAVGEMVPLTLTFKNAQTIEVLAPVKSLLAAPMHHTESKAIEADMTGQSHQHGSMH